MIQLPKMFLLKLLLNEFNHSLLNHFLFEWDICQKIDGQLVIFMGSLWIDLDHLLFGSWEILYLLCIEFLFINLSNISVRVTTIQAEIQVPNTTHGAGTKKFVSWLKIFLCPRLIITTALINRVNQSHYNTYQVTSVAFVILKHWY